MADINVDVNVLNATDVEVSSPPNSINAIVNLPPILSSTVTSPTQALATNISIPGPQGPRGEKGNPTTINSLSAENIIITGSDGNIVYNSGLNTIFIFGNSGYFQSAVNSLTTNLNDTGANLNTSINNLSGLFTGFTGSLDATYATDSQLNSTGNTLNSNINSLSGTLTSNYATITNLSNTGSTLQTNINNLSNTYATIINLASTGSNLNNTINSLSGTVTGNYVTKSNGQFTNRPTVNGTGVLLSGEAASLPTTILYTTGNQIKSGRLIIGDDAISIVDPNSPYTLSLQTNSPRTWLEILNNSGTNKGVFFGIEGDDFEQYNWQAGDIKFFTSQNFSDGTERLRIKNDGKVGIGTSSPSELLEVNGNIKAATGVYATNLVYNTGNQTISGNKTFTEDLVVQKSGFFWSGIKIGLNSIIITEESIKISGDPVIVRSTFTGYTGDVVNTYATIINLASTGSSLNNSISSLSGNLTSTYATINNLASTGSTLQSNISSTGSSLDNKIGSLSGTLTSTYATITNLASTGSTLATNLASTGSTLDTKINTLSGSSVLLYGNQSIGGVKTFRDNVYINNLFVTGTETIVSTNNFNVQSPYVLLNLTGGAVDGGIFFVTGSGLTGINSTGPIIGFDHSTKFKFGFSTRNSDLSTLPDIASVQDIQAYSGVADNKFSTIINLASTGSTLQTNINTVSSNLVLTGNNLEGKISSLSGTLTSNYATITNLANTGSTLNTRINNLSGYINSTSSNIVFTTGNQIISGVKSFAQDTTFGDSAQGDFLVISGNNFIVYGSGNFTSGLFVNGNAVLTGSSTLYATTINLASTGSTLDTKINNLSGVSVLRFGDQTISGIKTFDSSPIISSFFNNGATPGYVGRASNGSLTLYASGQSTSVPSFYGWNGFGNSSFQAVEARTNLGLTSTATAVENSFIRITGDQTINGLKTFTSGIDIYSGTSPQSLRIFNCTGTNSGEFGSIGWTNNQFVIGSQQSQSGILRDVVITGNNININGSGALNIFDNTNIVGNLTVSGNTTITGNLNVSGRIITPQQNKTFVYRPNVTGVGAITGVFAYGANCTLTPRYVGTLRADACISMTQLGGSSSDTVQTTSFWYGTGTAPVYSGNLVNLGGTRIGGIKCVPTSNPATNLSNPFGTSWVAEITGLNTGTQYWFDIGISGLRVRVQDVQLYIEEKY